MFWYCCSDLIMVKYYHPAYVVQHRDCVFSLALRVQQQPPVL